ncbi:deoxyribonuclease [Cercopithecine alphaherpesvirus 9]|uniref:Deoxyribonuclease n=1 Tax=Cercopithecine herpesvirus 9 (strain DHV) TaxID=36348 RepID=Q9E1X2_CHV9D|nr:deoxyribonuclease [Cercopithecine alphaherpesvirus 9]AAG27222.1 deoxyribonuclease [Cercopithecine alphaherpesvirus 9]
MAKSKLGLSDHINLPCKISRYDIKEGAPHVNLLTTDLQSEPKFVNILHYITQRTTDQQVFTLSLWSRLLYAYRLMLCNNYYLEDDTLFSACKELFTDSTLPPKLPLNAHLDRRDIRDIFLTLESLTRGQSNNSLWPLLRRSMVTASVMKWGSNGPIFPSTWYNDEPSEDTIGDNTAIMFGKTNEYAGRSIIESLCIDPSDVQTPDVLDNVNIFNFDVLNATSPSIYVGTPNIRPYECGLLIDIRTGLVGASLDVLVCDRNFNTQVLHPHPAETNIPFFEIKCRAKYLFTPNDNTILSQSYENLLKNTTIANLQHFLFAIRNPCISFFESNPSTSEALVTTSTDWKHKDTRNGRSCTEIDAHHIHLNKHVMSQVWVFRKPSVQHNVITTADWNTGESFVQIPVFANPRHLNFKQILVQAYVLSGYFPTLKLRPHLLTFIGRARLQEEEGICFTLDTPTALLYEDKKPIIPPHCAVPVLAILTPIEVDIPRIVPIIENEARAAIYTALKLK